MFTRNSVACAVVLVLLMAGLSAAQTPVTCGQQLTAPGLYVLNEDLACGISIFIKSDNVTLDLQGHTLSNTSGSPITAIVTSAGPGSPSAWTTNGTRILNGTITGFGTAIALSGPVSPGLPRTTDGQVRQMTLTGNGRGIYVSYAANVVLEDNVITACVPPSSGDPGGDSLPYGVGIVAFDLVDSQVRNNELTGNTYDGVALRMSKDNKIMNNRASGNGRYGILISDWGWPSVDNLIKHNEALGNLVTDLVDLNGCDANLWKNNAFGTSNSPDCIR